MLSQRRCPCWPNRKHSFIEPRGVDWSSHVDAASRTVGVRKDYAGNRGFSFCVVGVVLTVSLVGSWFPVGTSKKILTLGCFQSRFKCPGRLFIGQQAGSTLVGCGNRFGLLNDRSARRPGKAMGLSCCGGGDYSFFE